jgi:hypothetical protein
MNLNEMLICLTIAATIAGLYAKQLNDAEGLQIKEQLSEITNSSDSQRDLAYQIVFDGTKEPPERPALDEGEVVEFLLELAEIDPIAADQAIQSLLQMQRQE